MFADLRPEQYEPPDFEKDRLRSMLRTVLVVLAKRGLLHVLPDSICEWWASERARVEREKAAALI